MHPPERHQQKTATPDVTLWGRRVTQRAASVAVWLSLAFLIMSPSLAWGHTDPPPLPPLLQDSTTQLSTFVDVPSPEPFPYHSGRPGLLLAALLFLASVGFSGIMCRPRRAAALCFVLVLSLHALSIAIHSVHHLVDAEQAAKCLMFSLSQHVTGTSTANWELRAPNLVVEEPALVN